MNIVLKMYFKTIIIKYKAYFFKAIKYLIKYDVENKL